MPTETPESSRIFLNNVHLKGHKSVEDMSIDFQKGLNILIGKNGSGKSNFMEFLFEVMLSKPDDKFLFSYARLELASDDSHSFVIELEKEFRAKITMNGPDDNNGLLRKFFIDGEIMFDSVNDGYSKKAIEFKNRKIKYNGNLRALFAIWGYNGFYPLFIKFNIPDKLEGISMPGSIKASLGNSFINISYPETVSFMDMIFYEMEIFGENGVDSIRQITKSELLEDLVIQEEILNNLRLYTTIEDVRFSDNIYLYKDEKSVIIENIKLEFKVNGNWLPWSQLSDGTKRLFVTIQA
ncbi:AAA family ATPase [Mucilaginibacter sp.]|uniref:AAA family ATPase n=1 Tax=Mucilaginibacter sp. TaxID=1882438 RepID=UPI00284378A6|nr:AAA family ATPase [Mucilaginibacter sp.]MDR3693014.1 AAA family ATPase [Mucilaginibacter sp.]